MTRDRGGGGGWDLAILDAPKKSRSGKGKKYRVLFSLFLQVRLLTPPPPQKKREKSTCRSPKTNAIKMSSCTRDESPKIAGAKVEHHLILFKRF